MTRPTTRLYPWLVALGVAAFATTGSCTCGDADEEDLISLPESAEPRVIEMMLAEPPEEGGETDLLGTPAPELLLTIEHLLEVAERDGIDGLFLRLGPMGGGWARARDLVNALATIRDAKKPVHCHADVADNVTTLILLTGCDRVSMTPAGIIDLVGPAAQVFYAKNLLDKIGVRASLVQVGRYKGAADVFTHEEMPAETRESLGAILDDMHGALVDALVKHRKIPRGNAKRIIDGGPYDAWSAKRIGLIDDVEFDDEAREHARRAGEAPRVQKVSLLPTAEAVGIGDVLRALAGSAPDDAPVGPRIALFVIEGTIVDAERPGFGGVRSGPLVRALRKAAKDDDIKAVVLRIQSPGGSALASDRLWHAVRRVRKHKPVIVSVGDMAASGGYYIASAGSKILAHDVSLVGSIGVVGGKILVDELANDLGVNVEILTRGQHAGWMSPFHAWTDDERAMFERQLNKTYQRFLGRVAKGREMAIDRVRAAAEGRLMTGRRAKQLGLVDDLGGLADALSLARKEGGLEPDSTIERWPDQKTLLDAIAQAMGGQPDARSILESDTLGELREPTEQAIGFASLLLGHDRVLTTLPFVLRID